MTILNRSGKALFCYSISRVIVAVLMSLACHQSAYSVDLLIDPALIVVSPDASDATIEITKKVTLFALNKSNTSVHFESIQSSCTCVTHPDVAGLKIPPGDRIRIELTFRLKEGQNFASADILAKFSDGTVSEAEVRGSRIVPIAIESSFLPFVESKSICACDFSLFSDSTFLASRKESLGIKLEGVDGATIRTRFKPLGGGETEIINNVEIPCPLDSDWEFKNVMVAIYEKPSGIVLFRIPVTAFVSRRWSAHSETVVANERSGVLEGVVYLVSPIGETVPEIEIFMVGEHLVEYEKVDLKPGLTMVRIKFPRIAFKDNWIAKGEIVLSDFDEKLVVQFIDAGSLMSHFE